MLPNKITQVYVQKEGDEELFGPVVFAVDFEASPESKAQIEQIVDDKLKEVEVTITSISNEAINSLFS